MLKISFNEMVALQMILEFVSVEELITSSMNGFAAEDTVKSQDNSDICSKALQAFL